MSQGHEVVIRRSWGAVIAWFGLLVPIFGAFPLMNWWAFGGRDSFAPFTWTLLIVILVIDVVVLRRMSVTLRDDVLIVRNVRRTEIPLGRIRAVRIRSGGYFAPYLVEIYDGQQPVALRVTTAGWRSNRPWTDAQLHVVGQWWLAHGGAEQQAGARR